MNAIASWRRRHGIPRHAMAVRASLLCRDGTPIAVLEAAIAAAEAGEISGEDDLPRGVRLMLNEAGLLSDAMASLERCA